MKTNKEDVQIAISALLDVLGFASMSRKVLEENRPDMIKWFAMFAGANVPMSYKDDQPQPALPVQRYRVYAMDDHGDDDGQIEYANTLELAIEHAKSILDDGFFSASYVERTVKKDPDYKADFFISEEIDFIFAAGDPSALLAGEWVNNSQIDPGKEKQEIYAEEVLA